VSFHGAGDPEEFRNCVGLCQGHCYKKNSETILDSDAHANSWSVSHFNSYGALLKDDLVYKNYQKNDELHRHLYKYEVIAMQAARFCRGVVHLHDCSPENNVECVVCFRNAKTGEWKPTKKRSLIMESTDMTLKDWIPANWKVAQKCMQTWYESLRDSLKCLHGHQIVHGFLKRGTLRVSADPDGGKCPLVHLAYFGYASAGVGDLMGRFDASDYKTNTHLPSSLFKGQPDLLGLKTGKYFKLDPVIDWCSFIHLFDDLARVSPLKQKALEQLINDGVVTEAPACGVMGPRRS